MQHPITRAWQDTKRSYGVSWPKLRRKFLTAAAMVALVYLALGKGAAMSEAWIIGASFAAALLATFIPEFLWNLWLAPYKILREQIARTDERIDAIAQPPTAAAREKQKRSAAANMKLHDARQDMGDLKRCLEHGIRRVPRRGVRYAVRDCEHYIPAIKQKYANWLPSEEAGCDLVAWIGRIEAILAISDYETADSIIKDAAAKGSWDD